MFIEKCKDCDFAKMHENYKKQANARDEAHDAIFKKIAWVIDPVNGLKGHYVGRYPELIAECINDKGDKAKMNKEIKELKTENERLALMAFRQNKQ